MTRLGVERSRRRAWTWLSTMGADSTVVETIGHISDAARALPLRMLSAMAAANQPSQNRCRRKANSPSAEEAEPLG